MLKIFGKTKKPSLYKRAKEIAKNGNYNAYILKYADLQRLENQQNDPCLEAPHSKTHRVM